MASSTANRHRMRCNACRRRLRRIYGKDASARFTLKRHPLDYKREPKCPVCKSTDVASIEPIRARELASQARCYCSAYPFPHRYGSLRLCEGHRLRDVEPDADEWRDYEACLATPRTGWA